MIIVIHPSISAQSTGLAISPYARHVNVGNNPSRAEELVILYFIIGKFARQVCILPGEAYPWNSGRRSL
jgi:hypothetical protein